MKYKDKIFAIAEHNSNAVGPGVILSEILNQKKVRILYHIFHPNLYMKRGFSLSSKMKIYTHGVKTSESNAWYFRLPEPILYIKDIVCSFLWLVQIKDPIDIYVGMGDLNAAIGIMLRKIGTVKRVVYYVIDYIPNRFRNPILNWVYHQVEKFAATHADVTWNLSPRMIEAREKKWRKVFPNQTVLPHGLHFDTKKILPFSKIHKTEIIYMGHLNEEQGIQLLIEALPSIKKKIPAVRFTIIGWGNDEEKLHTLVKHLHLESTVQFLGGIPDNQKMELRLAQAALGIALYMPNHGFSYYTDPGKIKHYVSVGLPVLMTGIPAVSHDIAKAKCGIVIPYTKQACREAIIYFLSSPKTIQTYRENAIAFAKQYEWQRLFSQGLHYKNLTTV